jgi:phosphoglycolate phosphatase-like HAD superfamily hydrolase
VELYWQTAGLAFRDQIEALFPSNPANSIVAQEFERWKAQVIKDVIVGDEAKTVIRELKKRGIIVAVSSNNLEKYVREVFLRSDVKPDFVLGFREDGFKKGEPHFRYIEEKTGINRKEFLFVGDSLRDLMIAQQTNVAFLALEGRFKKEDFQEILPSVQTITAIRKVLDYLESDID